MAVSAVQTVGGSDRSRGRKGPVVAAAGVGATRRARYAVVAEVRPQDDGGGGEGQEGRLAHAAAPTAAAAATRKAGVVAVTALAAGDGDGVGRDGKDGSRRQRWLAIVQA